MSHRLLQCVCGMLAGLTCWSVLLLRADERPEAPRELDQGGKLTRDDPRDHVAFTREAFCNIQRVTWVAGHTYRVELTSRDFRPHLRLEDPMGNQVASAPGTGSSARLTYRPAVDGVYRIIVTSYMPNATGNYTLRAGELGRADELEDRLKQFARLPATEQQQVLADLRKYLAERGKGLTPSDVKLAIDAARALPPGDRERAATVCKDLAQLVSAATDPAAAAQARILTGLARRLNLAGAPIDLKGTTIDGRPFNWETYRGQVVLVEFWAAQNPGNSMEWLNMRNQYTAYHSMGFEIVLVNVDADRQVAADFLRRQPAPWMCLYDARPADRGWGPLAEQYGVLSTPLALLVDREGRLVETGAGALELLPRLASLVSSPPKTALNRPAMGAGGPPLAGTNRSPVRPTPLPGGISPQPGTGETSTTVFSLVGLLIVAILLSPFAVILAFQASRRGFSFAIWLLAGFLSFNPLLPLVLLGLLPNRSRQALRRLELANLDSRLASEPRVGRQVASATVSPEALPVERAVASTLDQPARSLGDEETRP